MENNIYISFLLIMRLAIPYALMGSVFSVRRDSKIARLKRMLRVLERHRRNLATKIGRLNRELHMIENKLRKSIAQRKVSDDSAQKNPSYVHDSSTQVSQTLLVRVAKLLLTSTIQLAQEILFKRGQTKDLDQILQKINCMHETVRFDSLLAVKHAVH